MVQLSSLSQGQSGDIHAELELTSLPPVGCEVSSVHFSNPLDSMNKERRQK